MVDHEPDPQAPVSLVLPILFIALQISEGQVEDVDLEEMEEGKGAARGTRTVVKYQVCTPRT